MRFTLLAVLIASFAAPAYAREAATADAAAGNVPAARPSSGPELRDATARLLARITQVAGEIAKKVEEAKATRDPILMNCVNEKSMQVKGLLSVAKNASEDIEADIVGNDLSAAGHEFDKLEIARGRADEYRIDAEACVGSIESGSIVQGSVETEEADGLPADRVIKMADPTAFEDLPASGIRPPAASPMR